MKKVGKSSLVMLLLLLVLAVTAFAETTPKVEYKEIYSFSLYYKTETGVEELQAMPTEAELNAEKTNYLIEVKMNELPSFYAEIQSASDGKLVLDCDNVVQYDANGKQSDGLSIDTSLFCATAKKQVSVVESTTTALAEQTMTPAEFIQKLQSNLTGTVQLTCDLDFSGYSGTEAIITSDFKGTLDGNGYTITGLKRPLFAKLNGATVKNLLFENADLTVTGAYDCGLLAKTAEKSTVENVHIQGIRLNVPTNAQEKANNNVAKGGLLGSALNGTSIKRCSVTELSLTSVYQLCGGMVGKLVGSSIENSHVSGIVNANESIIGGMVGWAMENTVLSNCLTEVTVATDKNDRSFVGCLCGATNPIAPTAASAQIKNCVSLSSTSNTNVCAICQPVQKLGAESVNNYVSTGSNWKSTTDITVTGQNASAFTKDFYTGTLGWSESYWTFGTDGAVSLKKPSAETYVPTDGSFYLPDYEEVFRNDSRYTSSKVRLYHNLYRLMPFMDSANILTFAQGIDNENLQKRDIRTILPVGEDGEIVIGISKNNYSDVKRIAVVYTDSTMDTFAVEPVDVIHGVAVYRIPSLNNAYYNYDGYAVMDVEYATTLANRIRTLDYGNDLYPTISGGDSRLYWENFSLVKQDADKIALAMMSHEQFACNLDGNAVLRAYHDQMLDMANNKLLARYMYGYNYYHYWYSFHVADKIPDAEFSPTVRDLLLFYGGLSGEKKSSYTVTGYVLGNAARSTRSSYDFFTSKLSGLTGKANIAQYIEYLVKTLTDYKSAELWFADYFESNGNILIENKTELRDAKGNKIDSSAWSLMQKGRREVFLPTIKLASFPNCAYFAAAPTMLSYGSLLTYSNHPATDTAMRERVRNYGEQIVTFYRTASGFIDANYFNNKIVLSVDTPHSYPFVGATSKTWASPGTQSPFYAHFSESVGMLAANNGSAGWSNGSSIYFICYPAVGDIDTWSHETGHCEDSSVFLKNQGRRNGAWAEDYADGNTAQRFGDGTVNFNLINTYNRNALISNNLTPERIDTLAEIEDYYKKMFEVSDMLDYLEAQAFLQLTPQEQYVLSVQVNDTANGTQGYTKWTKLSEQWFVEHPLKTVDDLWNNKITIKPGALNSSAGPNSYGHESLYTRRWYIPHNDNGRPDSNTFKYTAWAMLGEGGYDNGYIAYYSNRNKTDLGAIQAIGRANGKNYTSWADYHHQRYATMAEYAEKLKWLDAEVILEDYLAALKEDAANADYNVTKSTNVKRMYYYYLKRVTNDFTEGLYQEAGVDHRIHIKTCEEFVTKITENPYGDFVLDNDLDFTGVYSWIFVTFRGRLDGNGHKITINDYYPVLYGDYNIGCAGEYACIQDVILKDPTGGYETINLMPIKMSHVDVKLDIQMTHIQTAEQFAAIANNLSGNYILDKDIDFSNYTGSNPVVSGTFTGRLDGNGHTLKNINGRSLFDTFSGQAYDFTINGAEWLADSTTATNINVFAKKLNGATIHDAVFSNINLQGCHRVAAIAGESYGATSIENVSMKNVNVTGGNKNTAGYYNALMIGRSQSGGYLKMLNVNAQGRLTVFAMACGGLVGASDSGGISVASAVVNVDLIYDQNTKDSRNNTGAVIGAVSHSGNACSGREIFMVGKVSGPCYCFIGEPTRNGNFIQCYEMTAQGASSGISNVNNLNILSLKADDLTEEFFSNRFGDNDWWFNKRIVTLSSRQNVQTLETPRTNVPMADADFGATVTLKSGEQTIENPNDTAKAAAQSKIADLINYNSAVTEFLPDNIQQATIMTVTTEGEDTESGEAQSGSEGVTSSKEQIVQALKDVTGSTAFDAEIEGKENEALIHYIKLELKSAVVSQSTEGETTKSTVQSMTFDVTPMVATTVEETTTDDQGRAIKVSKTIRAVIPNTAISENITFRLPVDADVEVGTIVNVYHEQDTEVYCTCKVEEEQGNKFIQLSAKEFSQYRYEIPPVTLDDAENSMSLSLEGAIGLNFYIDKASYEKAGYVPSYVELTWNHNTTSYSGARTTEKIFLTADMLYGDTGLYRVSGVKVTAAQISDAVDIKLYDTNGDQLWETSTSVEKYCKTILQTDDTEENLRQLCAALLQYGAAAQNDFGYRAGTLDAVMKELNLTPVSVSRESIAEDCAQSGWFYKSSATGENRDNFKTLTFVALGDSSIRVYTKTAMDWTVLVGETEVVAKNVVCGKNNNGYYVEVSGISSTDLKQDYTFLAEGLTVRYSPICYAYSILRNTTNLTAVALGEAIYNYAVQANNYFGA